MADVVVVAGVVAFFAICVWFVHLCDRIIGPDDAPEAGRGAAVAVAAAEPTR